MTDIVERLRECSSDEAYLSRQAADEITRLTAEVERLGRALNVARYGEADFAWSVHEAQMVELRAENERLRAALEPLACTCDRQNGAACSRSEVDCPFWNARAALGGNDE